MIALKQLAYRARDLQTRAENLRALFDGPTPLGLDDHQAEVCRARLSAALHQIDGFVEIILAETAVHRQIAEIGQ